MSLRYYHGPMQQWRDGVLIYELWSRHGKRLQESFWTDTGQLLGERYYRSDKPWNGIFVDLKSGQCVNYRNGKRQYGPIQAESAFLQRISPNPHGMAMRDYRESRETLSAQEAAELLAAIELVAARTKP